MPRARQPFLPSPRHPPSRREPVTAHLRKPPVDGLVPRHSHPYGQLACPTIGAIRLTAQNVSWIAPMFRAVWVPPQVEHQLAMLGKVEFHVVYIDQSAACLPKDRCCVIEMFALTQQLIKALAESDGQNPARHQLLMKLLLEELRNARSISLGLRLPTDQRLAAVCDAILEDPALAMTQADWAAWGNISERTLARLFQLELGTSFGAWRQQVRLAKAVDLMSRGYLITDIASELGYANTSAFTTMFKRALGVPPSQFNLQPV